MLVTESASTVTLPTFALLEPRLAPLNAEALVLMSDTATATPATPRLFAAAVAVTEKEFSLCATTATLPAVMLAPPAIDALVVMSALPNAPVAATYWSVSVRKDNAVTPMVASLRAPTLSVPAVPVETCAPLCTVAVTFPVTSP